MTLHSPAADRNKGPILSVLQQVLPASGHLLELASGSGQHVCEFAAGLPGWTFSPTDLDEGALRSIDAYVTEAALGNVRPSVKLDACVWPWPVESADAVLAVNMVHISVWEATEGLFAGAGRVLGKGGRLVLYGPFVIDGETAESNLRFSDSLKERNKLWGVRELREVERIANVEGLGLVQVVEMPANNNCVVFEKGATGQ